MNPDPREFYTDPQVIALIKAIDNEDLAEIKSLKAKGVNLNAAGRNPLKGTDEFEATTPLYWAYLHKKKAAYQLLLELGADPNQEVPGHWSMMNLGALDMHDSDWLRLAIDHGGNLNSEAFSKLTPLMARSYQRAAREFKAACQGRGRPEPAIRGWIDRIGTCRGVRMV